MLKSYLPRVFGILLSVTCVVLVGCHAAELVTPGWSDPSSPDPIEPPEPISNTLNHWEMLVDEGGSWHYLAPTEEPVSTWKTAAFVTTDWPSGPGGIGYGDDDDATVIEPTLSLYMRTSFEVISKEQILEANLFIDYDDAFIAYLNGEEIARAGIGEPGDVTAFDTAAEDSHEARLATGGLPDRVDIDVERLLPGKNHLAVQIHNTRADSSDLSSRVFIAVGMSAEEQTYLPLPDWFDEPMTSSDLPLIFIDTAGQSVRDDPRITAHMRIVNNGPGQRNALDDPATDYDGRISIEWRGSTSQNFPKKQYGFETQDESGENNNVSLLGMPSENDWILNAPYSDKSLVRNVLAYDLGNAMGRYAPRTQFCEVFLNGSYEGVYVLMEQVKRDKDRVNIEPMDPTATTGDAITGGYIVKIDKFTGSGGEGWDSSIDPENWNQVYYQYDYPEEPDLNQVQKDYLESSLSDFETKLFNGDPSYRDAIDVGSFIDFMIVQEISRNVDAYRLSTFLHKFRDSAGGLIHMGPLWDFNLAFGNADYGAAFEPEGWAFNQGTPFWWASLLEDPVFVGELRCRWESLRGGLLSDQSVIARLAAYEERLSESQERNFQRWPILGEYLWPNNFIGQSHLEEMDYLENWLLSRLQWLDSGIPGSCPAGE
ncbi:MAG: CotH kinase family protein [Deltaproteobacteria bacterium]|nr:CotH kinase family protein [Deltaproteobacteria bacterium]